MSNLRGSMSTIYDQEEKDAVLAMLAEGKRVTEIVEITGIPRSTVYLWKKSTTPGSSSPSSLDSIFDRLSKLEHGLHQALVSLQELRSLGIKDAPETYQPGNKAKSWNSLRKVAK